MTFLPSFSLYLSLLFFVCFLFSLCIFLILVASGRYNRVTIKMSETFFVLHNLLVFAYIGEISEST